MGGERRCTHAVTRGLVWAPVTAELRRGPRPVRWLLDLYYRLGHLVRELMKFGVVGAVAYVVDFGLFNVFRVLLDFGPLTSKVLRASLPYRSRMSATGIGRSGIEPDLVSAASTRCSSC